MNEITTRESRSQVRLAVLVVSLVVASGIFFRAMTSLHPWYGGWGVYEFAEPACIQQTSDGGFIILGNQISLSYSYFSAYDAVPTRSITENGTILVIKTDLSGNIEWRRTYGGGHRCWAQFMNQTADGGYVIQGILNLTNLWLIKTDWQGRVQWDRVYSGMGSADWLASSVRESGDSYVIAGVTSYPPNTSKIWIIKTDSQGNTEWNRTSQVSPSFHAVSIGEAYDEGYLITGRGFIDGNMVTLLLSMDRNGTLLWNVTYPATGLDQLLFAFETSDGGLVMAGNIATQSWSSSDFWLVKSDSNGTLQWNKTYNGGQGRAWLNSAQRAADGGYLLVGSRAADNGTSDFWVLKTNEQGIAEWNRTYGLSGYMNYSAICSTADGGNIIAGHSASGRYDVWLIRLDAEGSTVWDRIVEFPAY